MPLLAAEPRRTLAGFGEYDYIKLTVELEASQKLKKEAGVVVDSQISGAHGFSSLCTAIDEQLRNKIFSGQ